MRARRKKWVSPFLDDHPYLNLEDASFEDPFFKSSPLYLEVGFGKGDFILGLSAIQEGHYLGIERDLQVCCIAEKKRLEAKRENVKLLCGDIDFALERFGSLRFDVIYLNFSDPWPKLRHAKRRLTFAPRLNRIASFLKEGGRIILKTDNPGLYEFTLEQLEQAHLQAIEQTDHYDFDPVHDAMSEYERAFREEGKNIHRLVLTR